jgi:hypothetical protein
VLAGSHDPQQTMLEKVDFEKNIRDDLGYAEASAYASFKNSPHPET